MIAQDKAAARCHWHSLVEPVGSCAVCGQAGCGTCLVQDTGGYRCQECIQKGKKITPATPIQPQPPLTMPPPGMALGQLSSPPLSPLPVQPLAPQPARFKYTKILISLALFLAGAAIPVSVTEGNVTRGLTLNEHLTIGYVLWALFWGAPAAWRLWRRFIFNKKAIFLGCTPVGFAWLVTAPLLLIFGGWGYCLLGGGIYQFLKHLWSVSRAA